MINLLKDTYPNSKGIPCTSFSLDSLNGEFSLTDPKACNECKKQVDRCPSGCDEVGIRIHTGQPMCILRFDSYIEQFHHDRMPSNCDYLLFDEGIDVHKIAFCDITCSTSEYVEPNSGKIPEGKRARCRIQMQTSLNLLSQEELLAARIFSIPNRVALFGWREYMPKDTFDKASSSMKDFGLTPSSKAGILEYPEMALSGNFKFIEVKYPHIYQWTEPMEDIAAYTE